MFREVPSGGGLVRDHVGKLVVAYYKEFEESDVISAEALALLHGLEICVERSFQSLQVEVDSEVLVQLVSSTCSAKWPLCNHLR